jgi:hypothetical protein
MASFSKTYLTGSADGTGILLTGTTAGSSVAVHTGATAVGTIDEVFIYASNTQATTAVNVTLLIGSDAVTDQITASIPAQDGLYQLVPGLILAGTTTALVVSAYAGTASVCNIFGYVNRIS